MPPPAARRTPVERDQARVHRADVDQPAEQRHAAVVRSAAVHAFGIVRHPRLVAPLPGTGPGVDREHARLVGRQVQHALVQQRRRFQSAVVSARGEHPRRLEAVNVIRSDLIELDEALVVETTNYRDMGEMRGSDLHTEALRIVERFTVVDPETIAYEARIDDRKTFTGEWTVAFPFQRDPAYHLRVRLPRGELLRAAHAVGRARRRFTMLHGLGRIRLTIPLRDWLDTAVAPPLADTLD